MGTKLFENMATYEVILLILGCVLFLISLVGIIIGMIRRETLKKYIPLLFIAIVMIGFSAIKKVSLGNDFISIEKNSNDYLNDPSDTATLSKLAENYKKINPDLLQTPQDLTSYAKAAMLLGENEISIKYVNKALDMDKNYGPANDVKAQAESNMAIKQVTLEPENEELKSTLAGKLRVLDSIPTKNNYRSLKLAEGHLLTGNTAKSREEANNVIAKNPDQKQAHEIIQLADVEEKIKKTKENPANKKDLQLALRNFKEIPTTEHQKAYKSAVLAKAYTALGDHQKSEQYKDSAKIYLAKPLFKK